MTQPLDAEGPHNHRTAPSVEREHPSNGGKTVSASKSIATVLDYAGVLAYYVTAEGMTVEAAVVELLADHPGDAEEIMEAVGWLDDATELREHRQSGPHEAWRRRVAPHLQPPAHDDCVTHRVVTTSTMGPRRQPARRKLPGRRQRSRRGRGNAGGSDASGKGGDPPPRRWAADLRALLTWRPAVAL